MRPLSITDVSRIHALGGSILRTSRANPTVRDRGRRRSGAGGCAPAWGRCEKLGVGALVTIGGDDTAFSASRLAGAAGGGAAGGARAEDHRQRPAAAGRHPDVRLRDRQERGGPAGQQSDDRRDHHAAVVPGGGDGPVGGAPGGGHREVGGGHLDGHRRGVPPRRADPAVAAGGRPGDVDAQADRPRPPVRRGGAGRGHRPAAASGGAAEGDAGGRAGRARPRPAGRA